jgi:hypothetical protein
MNVNHKSPEELERAWADFNRPADGARYRHYKGGEYEIVATGFLEESEQPCVIYRSIETNQVWVRTASNFLEMIDQNSQTQPRFMQV